MHMVSTHVVTYACLLATGSHIDQWRIGDTLHEQFLTVHGYEQACMCNIVFVGRLLQTWPPVH